MEAEFNQHQEENSSKSKRANGIVEAERMEYYRNILVNSQKNERIKELMAIYAYDATKIAIGQGMYDATKARLEACLEKRSTYLTARLFWNDKLSILKKEYRRHRNIARILFKKKSIEYRLLNLGKQSGNSYSAVLSTISSFYSTVVESPTILEQFATMNILAEQFQKGLEDVKQVELARSSVLNHSALSQEETRVKNENKEQLINWMTSYIQVAKIALEDEPLLLEALGIVIR